MMENVMSRSSGSTSAVSSMVVPRDVLSRRQIGSSRRFMDRNSSTRLFQQVPCHAARRCNLVQDDTVLTAARRNRIRAIFRCEKRHAGGRARETVAYGLRARRGGCAVLGRGFGGRALMAEVGQRA